MKNFIAYDKTTGAVLGAGCSIDPESRETEAEGVIVVDTPVRPSEVEVDISGSEPVLIYLDQTALDVRDFWMHKEQASYEVLLASEGARKHFITSMTGQDAIYQAKYNEAVAYQADASPDMANYPFLSAEIGITAANASDLATLWIQLRNGWVDAAAAIEKARLTANAAVQAATTKAELDATIDTLKASLATITSG